MKAEETPSKPLGQTFQDGQNKPSSAGQAYQIVLDYRKRPIKGLYQRHETYYARVKTKDSLTEKPKLAWFRLEATGLDEARNALKKLQVQQAEGTLVAPVQAPKFDEFAQKYLDYYDKVPDAKTPKTMASEKAHVRNLVEHFSGTRLNKITLPMVRGYIVKRQQAGFAPRTVNIGVVVLRNILNRAIEDGWLQRLPTENLKPLKCSPARKELITHADIERLCACALEHSKNGVEFGYYIKFLAYTGARRDEGLAVKWADVDFGNAQITIGADGKTKNRQARVVDFNDKLESLLREMHTHRPPDSTWLFPSPQRGTKDIPCRTFKESLNKARGPAGLPKVAFHHLRHYFISFCVMSGIDYMTIAKWVGHKDGGILIGKVYGHLAEGHTKAAARKLRFEPFVLEAQTA